MALAQARRRTGLVFDELYLWHDTGTAAGIVPAGPMVEPGVHAESPETKRRLRSLVEVSGLGRALLPLRPETVDEAYLLGFHTADYLERIRTASEARGGDAGELTPFGRGGFNIAALSAGGVLRAVSAVLAGEADNAYALVRPPGHHAEPDRGRGFCIFGNIALAVRHARRALGLGRVAIVDWDVHHGNGTQAAFYGERDVLTVSLHQDRLFPAASGAISERGEGKGFGANLNMPLPPGSGAGAYLAAFDQVVLPALHRFRPELVVVACGFDACGVDPFGRMLLHSGTFAELTTRMVAAADALCGGRLVLAHEGGYSPWATPYCGLAVLEVLSGAETGVEDPFRGMIEGWGGQALAPHQASLVETAAGLVRDVPE
jgi:acetoin utilization deacetylase AcuC-like enzyme